MHLCPTSPSDELPAAISKQYQPRTAWHLTDLRSKRLADTLMILTSVVEKLNSVADSLDQRLHLAFQHRHDSSTYTPLQREFHSAVRVVALRLRHRAALYQALIARGQHSKAGKKAFQENLNLAEKIRNQALQEVSMMEAKIYRYPVDLLAGRYDSYTAYDLGYLHPVHKLHFWEREEGQVRTGRSGPFFKPIYSMAKIVGLLD
jgi:hypothetical protein